MTLADDVDTRAITRRLREDGSLNGVLSTEQTKTNDELLEISRTWNIFGEDLTLWTMFYIFQEIFIF